MSQLCLDLIFPSEGSNEQRTIKAVVFPPSAAVHRIETIKHPLQLIAAAAASALRKPSFPVTGDASSWGGSQRVAAQRQEVQVRVTEL